MTSLCATSSSLQASNNNTFSSSTRRTVARRNNSTLVQHQHLRDGRHLAHRHEVRLFQGTGRLTLPASWMLGVGSDDNDSAAKSKSVVEILDEVLDILEETNDSLADYGGRAFLRGGRDLVTKKQSRQ
mmetsp:Transcript_120122/g.179477  ORF Transcript_120122/g.179477 Transcript_120122/m.179477 type:complete len:128 (-) Transcript_120122:302-685(-)